MLPKPAEKIRDIIKFIKNNRKPPQALLLENVKNFKTHDKSKTYARVRRELNELGYSVYIEWLIDKIMSRRLTLPQLKKYDIG